MIEYGTPQNTRQAATNAQIIWMPSRSAPATAAMSAAGNSR